MESFDIVTLRVFLAVARQGSIGGAARSEHIAASAVSRRIRELEQDLDLTLITRTPTGAGLTAAGQVFTSHCKKLLSEYASIRTDMKRFAAGRAGLLRIAAVPKVLDGSLPAVAARFQKDNPLVKVQIQELFSHQGVRFLREDIADLAIIYDSVNLKGFSLKAYKDNPIWVVGAAGHPLFKAHGHKKSIYFKQTLDYEYLSYHQGGVLDELIADALRKEGRTAAKYNIKLLRVASLIKCALAGLGLAALGELELRPHLENPGLKALPLADDWAERKIVCVFPKGQAASPTVRNFLEYLLNQG